MKASTGTRRQRVLLSRRFCAVAVVYALAGIALLPFMRYGIDQDGTAYISAARKYAAGDLGAAVTGHWSPLLPWLLVPWFRLGVPEVLAVKITLLLAGLAALAAFYRLSFRFRIDERARTFVALAFVPMALSYALIACTPDLLMLAALLGYLAVLLDSGVLTRTWAGVSCGALGGAAYLAKAYALPFFVLHFPLVLLYHTLRQGDATAWKRAAGHLAAGFAVFLLVAAPWVTVLSLKTGAFRYSTGGDYNWAFNHPRAGEFVSIDLGLAPPASARDISAFDNPPLPAGLTWNPLGSKAEFVHFMTGVLRRSAQMILILEKASVFAVPVALAALAWGLRLAWRRRWSAEWHLPLLTLLIFPSGYLMLCMCDRYVWPVVALLLLLSVQAVRALRLRRPALRAALAAAVTASFVPFAVVRLHDGFNAHRDLHRMAMELKKDVRVGGRLASWNRYRESLYLSYFMGAPYVGHTQRVAPADVPARLEALGVDYLLVWNADGLPPGPPPPIPAFLDGRAEVAANRFEGLRVFDLRRRRDAP